MEPILEVRNLNKFYKSKQVLKNISMKVFKGDIYGFIGPNGACVYRQQFRAVVNQ